MPVHQIDWYRTPLPPETLKALNERSNLLGFIQSAGYLACMITTGVIAYLTWFYTPMPWTILAMIPALLLHGTVCAFTINAVHELVHGTVFRSKWLNELFCAIFAFLGWHGHFHFWASHTEHHKFTLHPPDDLEVVLPTPQSLKGFLKHGIFDNPLNLRHRFTWHWRIARGKFQGEWELHILPPEAKKDRFKVRAWAWFLLIGHSAIILASLVLSILYPTSGAWLLFVLIPLSAHYGGLLFFFCNNTQHSGLIDYVPDFRLCCRTIYLNPITRFLYWHMNYHIEHHMYAGVPCYRLAKLHKAIQHELPYCPNGLVDAWAQILHIQQLQKNDPGYQYVQPLPGQKASESQLAVKRTPHQEKPTTATAASPTKPSRPTRNSRGGPLRRWECSICGFIYDEALGLPEDGISPGTAWEDIPDNWSCPDCAVSKADFNMMEIGSAVMDTHHAEETPIDTVTAPTIAPASPLVIIGSGLAGYSLAKELRHLGSERPITILTRDSGSFYSKPMLSNAFLEKHDAASLVKETPQHMAEKFRLDVRTGVDVMQIDRQRKVIVTSTGDVPYGQLLLAVGADQITLPLMGTGLSRVHQVNDLASYATFRAALPAGGKVLIIGAGLIGCEFANDLINGGHRVEVVDIAPQALNRLVPEPIGKALVDALTQRGVTFRFGVSVKSIDLAGQGLTCTLTDGTTTPADLVLSAVGLRPRINLAQQAGLTVNRGIAVDAQLRTSDPDIFALGDCAEVNGSVMPYILPLFEGARALAHTLAGQPRDVHYPPMPVAVKTPACPIVTCPPPMGAQGTWHVEGSAADLKALFHDAATGQLLGFALCGQATHDKHELARRMTAAAAPHEPAPPASPASPTAVATV